MPPAFCERADVRQALQKSTAKFGDNQLGDEFVDAAIHGISTWFLNATGTYWYDSGTGNDLISTTARSVTNIRKSVPSSPHRQARQVFRESRSGLRYPNPQDGVYCRVTLPKRYVESIDVLEVMESDGGVTDWVADSDITEGRGEDYYLTVDGEDAYGRSYLYLHADALGPKASYTDILSIDVTYGRDYQDNEWDDVQRGIGALAAAQIVTDDDVISQLPDQGQLIGVETQVQQLTAQALGDGPAVGMSALRPYFSTPVA